jgi:hypothetical protein
MEFDNDEEARVHECRKTKPINDVVFVMKRYLLCADKI